ncbi:MAG: nucleotide exchange factor GrpE [Firmicutes bacterium]|nr:nucleotide exchange factor GrpE [Bacillota bacterium]
MSEEKTIPIEEVEETMEAEETPAEEQDMAEQTEEVAESDVSGEIPQEEAGTDTALEDAEKRYQELNSKYMRLMADFQNQKKRFEKEKSDMYMYAGEDIIKRILEVMDNFDRALDMAGDTDPKFKEGMEMIFKQLMGVLEKEGVKEIEALGEEFDPNFHSAVMMEDTDEYESNKVSGVIQKGYTMKSKVLRPSMVKVSK